MSVAKLKDLRSDLEKVNQEIFSLFSKREKIVSLIQNLKRTTWDPKREHELFLIFSNEKKSFSDALIFSLLIEKQARHSGDGYPKWSDGIHLIDGIQKSSDMINPILLKFQSPAEYEKLKLKKEYLEQIEKGSSNDI